MFDLINRNAEFIVNSIPLDHLADYDWLLRHKEECGSPDYRRRFRNYWSMNPAQLGTTFYDAYFEMLGRPYGSSPSLQEVCRSLLRRLNSEARHEGTSILFCDKTPTHA